MAVNDEFLAPFLGLKVLILHGVNQFEFFKMKYDHCAKMHKISDFE